MQISVESLSSIKKKITFEIPAQQVQAEVDKAYAEIRKHAAIKGFRKGKVPMGLIEKHYGEKMADDVLKSLVNETYFKAVTEQGLNPVSYPVIESDPLMPGQPFRYSATVEVFPEVAVKDYLGLEVAKEQLVQDQAVIATRIREMQESVAQLVPAAEGHAAALGDFVVFDFNGTLDGVPFAGGAAEDYQLELGSGKFIPGFEEQLVGMSAGSNGTVKVSFPEGYGNAELAGKPAEFAVSVKEIKVKEFPELNDEFAKQFGEFETLDELRLKLSELQQEQESRRIDNELRERLIKALVEKNDLEVPEVLVDRQVTMMLENSKQRLASQRLSLEMMGLTEEGYKVQFRDVAREQVKGSLLLDAVAEKESLEVSDQDIAGQVAEIAAGTRQDPEKVANLYQTNARARENLIAQMREDKAVQFLLERAQVTELPKEEIKN
ncbi:MAG: trigger factor [Geobacteraceae bacterium GWC2_58_44]|nr:MAG: trigger factor [Geobacteraceae bacterium GWC2_58_44]HBG05992.1 trigger factor [Geobacter sp.]